MPRGAAPVVDVHTPSHLPGGAAATAALGVEAWLVPLAGADEHGAHLRNSPRRCGVKTTYLYTAGYLRAAGRVAVQCRRARGARTDAYPRI